MLPVPGVTIEEQPEAILLAMLAWGEARGDGYDAMFAVAWVAKNRSVKWQRSLRSVILQPEAFSCFLPAPEGEREKLLTPTTFDSVQVWNRAVFAAQNVIDGIGSDPTSGATHYVVSRLWSADDSGRPHPRWFSAQCIKSGVTRWRATIASQTFAESA